MNHFPWTRPLFYTQFTLLILPSTRFHLLSGFVNRSLTPENMACVFMCVCVSSKDSIPILYFSTRRAELLPNTIKAHKTGKKKEKRKSSICRSKCSQSILLRRRKPFFHLQAFPNHAYLHRHGRWSLNEHPLMLHPSSRSKDAGPQQPQKSVCRHVMFYLLFRLRHKYLRRFTGFQITSLQKNQVLAAGNGTLANSKPRLN